MPELDRPTVSRELLEQLTYRAARESFGAFCNVVELPDGPVRDDERDPRIALKRPYASHHQLMIDSFEAIERGEIKRLMLFFPPGVGKSIYSKAFLTWYAGRNPKSQVVGIAYNTEVAAEQIGKGCRYIVGQETYQKIFDCGLDPNDASTQNFAVTNESKFKIRGFGGGITSIRADLILIDDPIKNYQEAQSEVTRRSVKREYQASVLTRGRPDFKQIIVQTRWHRDDLAGSILPEDYDGESGDILCRDGEMWRVLCVPAEAEREDDIIGRKPGQMIWPEYYPESHWRQHRQNQMVWSALFQQRPAQEEGSIFQESWFNGDPNSGVQSTRYRWHEKFWMSMPFNIYMTSDHSDSTGGDYTVFSIWGRMGENLYLLDQHRGKGMFDLNMGWTVDDNGQYALRGSGALQLIRKYQPLAWYPENDPTFKRYQGLINQVMLSTNIYTTIHPQTVSGKGDKVTRAQPYMSMASMGLIHLPQGLRDAKGNDVGDVAIEEYLNFRGDDKGHDDQVDAHALIARMIAETAPGMTDVVAPVYEPDDGYKRVDTYSDYGSEDRLGSWI